MSRDDWSLRRRTTLQFAGVATAFLAVIGLAVAVTYRVVLASELDEELLEQLDEVRARYRAGPGGAAEFERLAAPTARESAETPMAWRAYESSTGRTWGPFGAERLRASFEGPPPAPGTVGRPDPDLRRHRGELVPGVTVDVVLDGTDWTARIRIVELFVLVIVLSGSALSLLAGTVFGRRLGRMLDRAAAEIERRETRDEGTLRLPGAPREIRAVAEAVETTLRETRQEVERARVLSAGLAHDLRAPVQALLTSTQVALLEPPGEADPRAVLEGHLDELRALTRTIDNLVAWGAPRLEGEREERVTFDLGREVESRLRGEEEEAARRGVFLDVQRSGDLALDGDPGALVLAIRNLVGNAIAWSPDGGQVLLHLSDRGDAVEIAVEDEGPGVPTAERERVFDPFVRGAAAPGRRAGYGLGLAIVAFAVARHGGCVQVEDAATGGARFVVRLPR